MADQTPFETRLADAFDRYVAPAPVHVNATAVAASVASLGREGWLPGRWRPARRRLALGPERRLVAAALLAVTAVTAVAVVGAGLGLLDLEPRRSPLSTTATPPPASIFQLDPTKAGTMLVSRALAIEVALGDGRVLIAGGPVTATTPSSVPAELFDPRTGDSTALAGDCPSGYGSAVLLRDGRVLAVTWDSNMTSSRAYLLDPGVATCRRLERAEPSNAPVFAVLPSMAVLQDGRVLIAGGKRDTYLHDLTASAVLFDPETESFTATGSMTRPRRFHSMTTLRDGRVLVVGGESQDRGEGAAWNLGRAQAPLGDAELFDPSSATFSPIAAAPGLEGTNAAVLLGDGRVLLIPTWLDMSSPAQALSSGLQGHVPDPRPWAVFDPVTNGFAPSVTSPVVPTRVIRLDDRSIVVGGVWGPVRASLSSVWWLVDPVTGRAEPLASPEATLPAAAVGAGGSIVFAGGWATQSSADSTASDRIEVLVRRPVPEPTTNHPTPETQPTPRFTPDANPPPSQAVFLRADLADASLIDVVLVRGDGQERLLRRVSTTVAGMAFPRLPYGSVAPNGWIAVGAGREAEPSSAEYELIDLSDPSRQSVAVPASGVIAGRWSIDGRFAVPSVGGSFFIDIVDPRAGTKVELGRISLFGGGPSIVWAADGSGILDGRRLQPVDGGEDVLIHPDLAFTDDRVGAGVTTVYVCDPTRQGECSAQAGRTILVRTLDGLLIPWYVDTDANEDPVAVSFAADGRSLFVMFQRIDGARHTVTIARLAAANAPLDRLWSFDLPPGVLDADKNGPAYPRLQAVSPDGAVAFVGWTTGFAIDPKYIGGIVSRGDTTVRQPRGTFIGFLPDPVAESLPGLTSYAPPTP